MLFKVGKFFSVGAVSLQAFQKGGHAVAHVDFWGVMRDGERIHVDEDKARFDAEGHGQVYPFEGSGVHGASRFYAEGYMAVLSL